MTTPSSSPPDVIDLFACTRCGDQFPRTAMYRVNATEPRGECVTCRKARRSRTPSGTREAMRRYHDRWRSANRERWLDANRTYKYGLPAGGYSELLATQSGGCAVCGAEPGEKSLHVDHDHATGVIRGLLCDLCNRGIGYFRDSPTSLRAAAHYLESRGV